MFNNPDEKPKSPRPPSAPKTGTTLRESDAGKSAPTPSKTPEKAVQPSNPEKPQDVSGQ